MGRPKTSIDSTFLAAVETAIKSIPSSEIVHKLIILSNYGRLSTEEIVRNHRITARTLFRWIKQFKANGIEGLRNKPKGHKPALLSEELKESIIEWITTQKDAQGNTVYWTLDKLREELNRGYSINISKPTLSVNLKKMRLVKRKPRPIHSEADQEEQEDFKKNFRPD
jgi:transposase